MSTDSADQRRRLTLFDLDHTLLNGDSDVLWCDFLIGHGLLEHATFAPRNADMAARYRAGTVASREFADFYVGTLAGKTPQQWDALRREFLTTQVAPRISTQAMELVQRHLAAGDLVVMTTATNRFITELTAGYFGIKHLLATEAELVEGRFTGRTQGTLNMREGKVARLREWMAAQGQTVEQCHSTAYSDSINDLALLEAVDQAVCVDPDPTLLALALARKWPVLRIPRPGV